MERLNRRECSPESTVIYTDVIDLHRKNRKTVVTTLPTRFSMISILKRLKQKKTKETMRGSAVLVRAAIVFPGIPALFQNKG